MKFMVKYEGLTVTPKRTPKARRALKSERAAKNPQRRLDVIRAAYHAIAEKGFEGLRMREIAKRAGLDHATLHYYFAGKEALIHGVLDYIVQELSIGRAPASEARDLEPSRRLAAHFRELVRQMREKPEMCVVLAEISARSTRDAMVRSVVIENDRGWKQFLTEILKEGVQKKEFDERLEPEAAAEAIAAMVRGLSITYAGRADSMERPLRQLRRWLEAK